MERHQGKCPLCGALVLVDGDGSQMIVHHAMPQCPGFEKLLREVVGKAAESVTISVQEVPT